MLHKDLAELHQLRRSTIDLLLWFIVYNFQISCSTLPMALHLMNSVTTSINAPFPGDLWSNHFKHGMMQHTILTVRNTCIVDGNVCY